MLITHRDFFDLAWAYFRKAHAQGVHHVELFFDPQVWKVWESLWVRESVGGES